MCRKLVTNEGELHLKMPRQQNNVVTVFMVETSSETILKAVRTETLMVAKMVLLVALASSLSIGEKKYFVKYWDAVDKHIERD